VNRVDVAWKIGKPTLGGMTRVFTPLRIYGTERVPLHDGVVFAFNHFSWIDPLAFGWASPRVIYFMAKSEAHRVPGLGQLIRSFGTIAVRRGESDREAVRAMRDTVRNGHALGLFVAGTRQRAGVPGKVQAGAAMVALQEDVPVLPAAIHGTQHWRPGNWAPVSILWGDPMRFEGLPKSGRGYREASAEIERELHRLWSFLVELHAAGRPAVVELP